MDERAFARTAEEYAADCTPWPTGCSATGRRRGRRPESAVEGVRGARVVRQPVGGVTWLYRVLTNVCIDELRRRRRTPPEELPRGRTGPAVERLT